MRQPKFDGSSEEGKESSFIDKANPFSLKEDVESSSILGEKSSAVMEEGCSDVSIEGKNKEKPHKVAAEEQKEEEREEEEHDVQQKVQEEEQEQEQEEGAKPSASEPRSRPLFTSPSDDALDKALHSFHTHSFNTESAVVLTEELPATSLSGGTVSKKESYPLAEAVILPKKEGHDEADIMSEVSSEADELDQNSFASEVVPPTLPEDLLFGGNSFDVVLDRAMPSNGWEGGGVP